MVLGTRAPQTHSVAHLAPLPCQPFFISIERFFFIFSSQQCHALDARSLLMPMFAARASCHAGTFSARRACRASKNTNPPTPRLPHPSPPSHAPVTACKSASCPRALRMPFARFPVSAKSSKCTKPPTLHLLELGSAKYAMRTLTLQPTDVSIATNFSVRLRQRCTRRLGVLVPTLLRPSMMSRRQ